MRRFLAFLPVPLALAVYVACGGSSSSPSSTPAADASDAPVDPPDASPDVATCDPPKRFCNTVCVDPQTDPNHCGKCGNVCSIGACTAGTCANAAVFAMTKLYMGDTDRNGAASSTAWRAFGHDLDGITSTSTANGECQLQAGAASSVRADGDDGIDNSFGRNVLPMLATFLGSGLSTQMNQALAASYFDYLVRIDGLDASNDIARLSGGFYASGPFTSPKFDGTDKLPVLFESVKSGDLNQPKIAWSAASMTARVFQSGDPGAGDGVLVMSFGLDSISVPLRKVRVSMKISADGSTATDGNLGGVIPTEAFVSEFHKLAGRISASLCNGSTFDAIAQQLRQSSDILQDGTQDPQKACDGISVGIGFDAKRDGVGAVLGPALPPVDVCE